MDRYARVDATGYVEAYYPSTPVQRQLAVTHALITGTRVLDTWEGTYIV